MTAVPLFWQHCLAAFQQELTPQQFNTWIRPLAVQPAQEGYRLLAPNRFVLQWVRERFANRIGELARVAEGRPVVISLGIGEPAADATRTPEAAAGDAELGMPAVIDDDE